MNNFIFNKRTTHDDVVDFIIYWFVSILCMYVAYWRADACILLNLSVWEVEVEHGSVITGVQNVDQHPGVRGERWYAVVLWKQTRKKSIIVLS